MSNYFLTEADRAVLRRVVRQELERRLNTRTRRRRHNTAGGSGSSSDVVCFRLEQELLCGTEASARIMNQATRRTQAGPPIIVRDVEAKWFGRGAEAAAGDDGGNLQGPADIGFAMKAFSTTYDIISMSTWYRWIRDFLSDDSWVVQAEDMSGHDGNWPRADDGTVTGNLTLTGVCDIEPVEGLEFIAKFNERERAYEVVTICCVEEEE